MTPEQQVVRWRARYDYIEEMYVRAMCALDPSRKKGEILDDIREECEKFLKAQGFTYPIYPTEK